MRSKNSAPDDQKSQNQGQSKRKNRDRNQKQETVKVVTAERAQEINNVMTQIAASTVAAHEAAGESSPITLPAAKKSEDLLEAVLDALPEPKAAGQGRRKPRRATSGGNVSAG